VVSPLDCFHDALSSGTGIVLCSITASRQALVSAGLKRPEVV